MKPTARLAPALPAAALALLVAAPAQAYIGPGVGLGVIGTVFGIVATLALAVFGFLWYPMKRLMAKRRGAKSGATSGAAATVAANEAAARPADPAAALPPAGAGHVGVRPDVVPVTPDAPAAPVAPAASGTTTSAPRAPERDGA